MVARAVDSGGGACDSSVHEAAAGMCPCRLYCALTILRSSVNSGWVARRWMASINHASGFWC